MRSGLAGSDLVPRSLRVGRPGAEAVAQPITVIRATPRPVGPRRILPADGKADPEEALTP